MNKTKERIFKSGDEVMIVGTKPGGQEVLEGAAVLQKLIHCNAYSEYWTVKFLADGFVCERWIETNYNPTEISDKRI